MQISKKVSFLGIIMFAFIYAFSLPGQTQNDPYRVETFSLNGAGKLMVKTSGGSITVKESGSNEVRVEMYVSEDGNSLSPNDTDLNNFDIDISKSGNQINAIAEREDGSGWKFWKNNDISISFVVYTPRKMSTNLHTSGGHIELSHLSGNQEISTSGGHISLTQIEGNIHAKTSGGRINIKQINGDVEARTSGGRIRAEDVRGRLNVRTSGGSIKLLGIHGTVQASTSGGSIVANIKEVGEYVKLRTSGGNISINVPKGIGLDLDLSGSRVKSDLSISSHRYNARDFEASINGGGPQIYAHTSGGIVEISFE